MTITEQKAHQRTLLYSKDHSTLIVRQQTYLLSRIPCCWFCCVALVFSGPACFLNGTLLLVTCVVGHEMGENLSLPKKVIESLTTIHFLSNNFRHYVIFLSQIHKHYVTAVSYTHLDVYKRQHSSSSLTLILEQ